MFCVRAVTVLQDFKAQVYQVLVIAIVGGFLGLQTHSDLKKKGDNNV